MSKLRDVLIIALICALCGTALSLTLLALYVEIDIVRQVPVLGKLSRYTLTTADIIAEAWLFTGYGAATLGIPLALMRERPWLAMLIYLFYPWSLACSIMLLLTPLDGLWYRAILNAASYCSIVIAQGVVSIFIVRKLRKAKVVN